MLHPGCKIFVIGSILEIISNSAERVLKQLMPPPRVVTFKQVSID
jgi:hypothetical protein